MGRAIEGRRLASIDHMYLCFVLLFPWLGHNSIEHVVSLQMLKVRHLGIVGLMRRLSTGARGSFNFAFLAHWSL